MRIRIMWLCVAVLASTPLLAQTTLPAEASEAAGAAFAQAAAMRAVNFKEGDAAALTGARADFTPEAWTAFMTWMGAFVDQKGTPTFTSSFVPSGHAVVVSQDNGIVHVRIPGTLRQSQLHGSTTYRATIDLRVGGTPIKVQHLAVATCSASTPATAPCG